MIELKRMVIYAKDIERITGKSDRYARKVMSAIRRDLKKGKNQLISMGEFCSHTGLPEEEVSRYMQH